MVQQSTVSPNGSPVSLLAHYTERAKTLETYILRFAVKDILATLELHRDKPTTDSYVAKLLAEFDAYTVELYNRDNPKNFKKDLTKPKTKQETTYHGNNTQQSDHRRHNPRVQKAGSR